MENLCQIHFNGSHIKEKLTPLATTYLSPQLSKDSCPYWNVSNIRVILWMTCCNGHLYTCTLLKLMEVYQGLISCMQIHVGPTIKSSWLVRHFELKIYFHMRQWPLSSFVGQSPPSTSSPICSTKPTPSTVVQILKNHCNSQVKP